MKENNKETQNEQPLVVMNISYISFYVILEINLLLQTITDLVTWSPGSQEILDLKLNIWYKGRFCNETMREMK